MRNLIIGSVVLIVIAFGAFFLLNNSSDEGDDTNQTQETSQPGDSNSTTDTENTNQETPNETEQITDKVTITYSNGSFSPSNTELKTGGTIVWMNSSSSGIEIGVDPHPTHTGDKAITNGEFTLNLGPSEQRSVTVNNTGNFSYHNHLNSNQGGRISIE